MIQQKKFETDLNNCSFCQSIKEGGVTPLFAELFPKLSHGEQILAETQEWFLVPDDSPLVGDHLLIIPKKHGLSCAAKSRKSLAELANLKSRVSSFLAQGLRGEETVFSFEHGAGLVANNCIARCGACGGHDHAHLHLLPLSKGKGKVLKILRQAIEQTLKLQVLYINNIQNLPRTNKPYLYLEENQRGLLFFPSEADARLIPSQFIRMLLGKYLSLPDQDWNFLHIQRGHRDLAKRRIRRTIAKFRLLPEL